MTTHDPDVEILHLETPNHENPPAGAVGSSPDASRCQHRYPNGTQCRFRGPELQSGLCLRHFREKLVAVLPSSPSDSEDLSADLLPELTEFSSGEDVQKFLARLVVQVTKGRVSPRRAAVLGYLTNQLLHSHRAIDKDSENQPTQFIFDIPRPKRDDFISPERAFVNRMAQQYGSASRGSVPPSTEDKPGAQESK